ncbi:AI-2E family transporter [Pedosphaera parvula]|uniref:Permease n=1 Tax=Pedosphaera parvula (strain Ellin514) TaxID=320771 RepID=B9XKF4_PEDPL|nr:AI-2E family transporter [Pedosphaera parvula]EEF59624.1 protein of unknown function UPF0118 [Pedosphaera parvula Ellin514]
MNFPPPTPRQAQVLWFALTAAAITVVMCLLVMLVWSVGWIVNALSGVLLPVAVALVLAYILDPVVEFFVRRRIPRLFSILLVFLLGVVIVTALLGSVVPGLVRETRKLVKDFPDTTHKLQSRFDHFLQTPLGHRLAMVWQHEASQGIAHAGKPGTESSSSATNMVAVTGTNNVESPTNNAALGKPKTIANSPVDEVIIPALTKAGMWTLEWITNQLSKVTTWVEFLIGFVLVPVYLFYFLLEKKGITRRWTDYLPIHESKAKQEIVFILSSFNDCMIVFFRGQVLVALCVGGLMTIAYLIMGLNYAVLLGAVIAVLGIVPYLGTITGLALALIVAAVQYGDWGHPLAVIAIVASVKLLEDFVIIPKIIGDRAGLHPLTIMVAVMVGTTLLGGFIGAVLAIPLTALLRTLMFRYIWKRRPATITAPEQALETEEIAS